MNMSSGTYELQKVLFKTLYIQICFISIILIAPLIISLMLASFGIRWVSTFALYAFMLISVHPFADFITMIYFIKPYRVFVIGLIKSILRKMGIKINTQIMPTAIVSTSMGNSASAIVNNNG
uniref:Uncharacterized protein n=1 Tax=Panagrolaimus sp. PS1159 TaxID=55785 RepID=A0AC35FEG8_9BILA